MCRVVCKADYSHPVVLHCLFVVLSVLRHLYCAVCAGAPQEVYFSGGNSERLSSLRHKKRYQVPQSPLLQVGGAVLWAGFRV